MRKTLLLLALLASLVARYGTAGYYAGDCTKIEQKCRDSFPFMRTRLGESCPMNTEGKCVMKLTSQQGSWAEMQQACEEKGGRLLMLSSADELYFLVQDINRDKENSQSFWIGGTDECHEGEFRWLNGDSVPHGTPFWGPGSDQQQDPDGGEAQNCILMDVNNQYLLADKSCDESHAALCEQVKIPYEKISNKCIMFASHVRGTWSEMRSFCKSANGDMAIIQSCDMMQVVTSHIQSKGLRHKNFWIGGRVPGWTRRFQWVDSSNIGMGTPFWGFDNDGSQDPDYESDENCLMMSADEGHYFVDRDCNEVHSVICMSDSQQLYLVGGCGNR